MMGVRYFLSSTRLTLGPIQGVLFPQPLAMGTGTSNCHLAPASLARGFDITPGGHRALQLVLNDNVEAGGFFSGAVCEADLNRRGIHLRVGFSVLGIEVVPITQVLRHTDSLLCHDMGERR